MSDVLRNLGRMDEDEYKIAVEKLYKDNPHKLNNLTQTDIDGIIKNASNGNSSVNKILSKYLENDFVNKDKGIVELLLEYENRDVFDAETITALKKIESLGPNVTLSNKTLYDDLAQVLKDSNVKKLLAKEDELGDLLRYSLSSFDDVSNMLFKSVDNAVTGFAGLVPELKGGDKAKDLFRLFKTTASMLSLGTLAIELAKATAVFVITANAKEMFTRFMQSVQALTIYPMTKSARPLIAGINGHKGSVYGAPTIDG